MSSILQTLRELNSTIQKEQIENVRKRKIRDRFAITTLPSHKQRDANKIDEIVQLLDHIDHTTEFKRSEQQKKFHWLFLASCSRQLLGNEFFVSNYKTILEQYYEFENETNPFTLICCPRRFGKTFSVAMFIACLLICVSEVNIAVFSPSKRQSVFLLELTEKFIYKLNKQHMIKVRNQERLFLTSEKDRMFRKASFYPSSINSLRGVSGSVIICEEMAHLNPAAVFQVILPLMQLRNAVLIGITTVGDESNYMTSYYTLKDNYGKLFFRTYYFHSACLSCREKGAETALRCPHLNINVHWQSNVMKDKIKTLYENSNNQALGAQELTGVINQVNQNAFPDTDVKNFINQRVPFESLKNIFFEDVFVSIDPSGGGTSRFSVCSSVFEASKMTSIVVGIEAVQAKKVEECYDCLFDHVKFLKRHFRDARYVFIIESNLGFESEHLAHFITKKITNFVILKQKDRLGLHTNHSFKCAASVLFKNRLKTKQVKLIENDYLATTSACCESIVKLYEEELLNFRRILKPARDGYGLQQEFYSGKTSQNSTDDCVMSTLLNIFWSDSYLMNNRSESL